MQGRGLINNILIVDDETTFARSLAEGIALCLPHLKVLTAGNGKEALEVLKTREIDLVFTDLRMPVMGGFELMEEIRRYWPRTRVIVMSMLDEPSVCDRIRELGAERFLEKPVDLQEVLNILGT
jgi:two-component system response regulator YesN